MNYKRLSDVAELIGGFAFKSADFTETGVPLVRIGEICESGIEFDDRTVYVSEENVTSKSKFLVRENDILVAMSGATTGKFTIYQSDEVALLNQRVLIIRKKRDINTKYLYYSMYTLKEQIENKAAGAAQPNISPNQIGGLLITVPPLAKQEKIVGVLDKAQRLIDARKEQIRLLDELIQSVFYEMFGDPVTNPKGWENQRLDSVCTKIGSGATPRGGKSSYKTEGISLIRSMNVHNGYFKYDDLAYINNAQAKKLNNVIVEKSDVLLNITGASVARSCIVPEKILPARVNQHVSIIRTNKEKANSRYINNLFVNSSFQKVLMKIGTSGGATREAITKEQLNELYIPIPNIQLQNEFDIIIQKIEESKYSLSKALIDLETNYYSLMQKAFKGDFFVGE